MKVLRSLHALAKILKPRTPYFAREHGHPSLKVLGKVVSAKCASPDANLTRIGHLGRANRFVGTAEIDDVE